MKSSREAQSLFPNGWRFGPVGGFSVRSLVGFWIGRYGTVAMRRIRTESRSPFTVRRSPGGGVVRTSVTLLVQDIGNTVTILVTVGRVLVSTIWDCLLVCHPKRTTNRRPDLSIIAPGRCAARMPGTGPLRRSSGLPCQEKIRLRGGGGCCRPFHLNPGA